MIPRLIRASMGRKSALCSLNIRRGAFLRFLATQKPFLLTDIGEGIQEVEILEWYVKEGDAIKEFDQICKVQSDKASVDITSRFEGTVRNLAKADIVKVGEPLLFVENNECEEESSSDEDDHTTVVETPLCKDASNQPADMMNQTTSSASHGTDKSPAGQMSPAVRKLVKDNSLDATNLVGTGPNGRILKSDVMGKLTEHNKPFETIQLRGYNRVMFDSMTKSLERPHMSLTDEIFVDNVWKMDGVSFLAVFLKAVSCSLSQYPILNATTSSDVDRHELKVWKDHNIGVAMDTSNGLVVPVLHGVQALSIREIQEKISVMKEKSPNFSPEDLHDATFTISNIGSIAGLHAQAVLGGDAVAMGVLGSKQIVPVYSTSNETFEPKSRVLASWTADHRYVDGATLAKFHKHLRTLLESPREWLLHLK